MNGLSWLIYWAGAGAADGLSNICGFLTVVGFVLGGASLIWFCVLSFDSDREVQNSLPYFIQFRRGALALLVFFGLIYFFLPTRQTVLLIAGSEMGERVLKSEQVQGVVIPVWR